MVRCAVLIPVYQPGLPLFDLVRAIRTELSGEGSAETIWIVNDGSDAAHDAEFERVAAIPGVRVIRHAVNLGKGAALKSGINAILVANPDVQAVVTADGDGQHTATDIARLVARVRQDPSRVYLGARRFDGPVPARSRFGNAITVGVTRLLAGLWVSDTQTGLRGLPRDLCEAALRIPLNGYDFEMECLIVSRRLRGRGVPITEVPIQTVYVDGNRSSHFNPLTDSMRIYFVFLRYCAGSLLTFLVDYVVFVFAFAQNSSIGTSILLARAVAVFVSFVFNRAAVFRFHDALLPAFLRFVALVAALGWVSYLATSFLSHTWGMSPVMAKLLVESILFFAGFALNNVFVFKRSAEDDERTDWDDYYSRPYKTATFTRRITTNLLIRLMTQNRPAGRLTMLELGGANSCFIEALRAALAPGEYHIADNNRTGLALSRERHGGEERVFLHEVDLLHNAVPLRADITFSVGLIEHFDDAGTARLVERHFDATREGGLVVITFPTATLPYRAIRGMAEWLKMWIFFDERPLREQEVLDAARGRGTLLYSRINWAIGLTQQVMAFRCERADAGQPRNAELLPSS